ncbi:uncharacterized protein LOC142616592 [Castanea sativa]|uniref:uncharacterized protein LOC142616592 n=1 Tax=Castanea sativa TaxID=21020 RepID=UPI003F651DA2
MGYIGPKFTWLYQKTNGEQIRERLDRALATQGWMDVFPNAKLYHLSTSVSDHSPLLLRMIHKPRKLKGKKCFRFESMWLKDHQCEEVVKEAWEEGCLSAQGHVLNNCLKMCQSKLDMWNKTYFSHVGKKIVELQSRLEWLEKQPTSHDTI